MGFFDWLRRTWTSPVPESSPPAASTSTGAPDPKTATEAWGVLTNVNEWVKHAETKLGVVLAFLGVLAAGLITLVIEVGRGSALMLALEGVSGLLLLLATGCASLGLLPQFAHEPDHAKLNPLYYGDIRRHFAGKPEEYAAHLREALSSPPAVTDHLARQIVANSEVAVRKYTWANRAIFLGFLSLLSTVAVVVGQALCW
ncbi:MULTISPECIES: Pycsar system effector family protein [Tessaracoccus]|uniref:Pycsar system effector family protein n=1 Tax=Tessaracoccus TaxID=72763 RepID=UPI003342061E